MYGNAGRFSAPPEGLGNGSLCAPRTRKITSLRLIAGRAGESLRSKPRSRDLRRRAEDRFLPGGWPCFCVPLSLPPPACFGSFGRLGDSRRVVVAWRSASTGWGTGRSTPSAAILPSSRCGKQAAWGSLAPALNRCSGLGVQVGDYSMGSLERFSFWSDRMLTLWRGGRRPGIGLQHVMRSGRSWGEGLQST